VSRAGDWEVRVFARTDFRYRYLVGHGMWHLQLWHSGRGVSVLTPSALTRDCYEIFPIRGGRARVRWNSDVRALVEAHHEIAVPSAGTMAVLEAWFVGNVLEPSDPIAKSLRLPGTLRVS
jgi:hypothetical protein